MQYDSNVDRFLCHDEQCRETHNEAGAIGFILFGSDGAGELTCDVSEAVSWDVFLQTKRMVLVPFTLPPMPLTSRLNSLAEDLVQSVW